MTYLLLQAFLLLLSAYFFGAFVACLVKRLVMPGRIAEPAVAEAPAYAPNYAPAPAPIAYAPPPVQQQLPPPVYAPPAPLPRMEPPPLVQPRNFDLVQPRIEVIKRPSPRKIQGTLDPSRFERALMGPSPNEGMPRRAIVELRPAVLIPATHPSRIPPPKLTPKALPPPEVLETGSVEEAPEAEAAPASPAPSHSGGLAMAAANAIAAAAVTAARAAAAAAAAIGGGKSSSDAKDQKSEDAPADDESAVADREQAEIAQAAAREIDSADEADDAEAEDAAAPDHTDVPDEATEPDDDADSTTDDDDEAEDDAAASPPEAVVAPEQPQELTQHTAQEIYAGDDFQRIRAIDADVERRLKKLGIDTYEHIAGWTPSDAKRISSELNLSERIEREQWVEQAQILAKGGETYYSRNRAAAIKAAAEKERPQQAALPPPNAAPAETATRAAPSPTSSDVPRSVATYVGSEKSVAELAAAAAAAIAAASASVTRGMRPIEPVSPLSKVDPKINIPAKLTDAIKEREARDNEAKLEEQALESSASFEDDDAREDENDGPADDLKRIRGIGVLIEKRLNGLGVSRYDHIANWTSSDIERVSQVLDFKGRIERENWVEQARILSSGGQTEFSRRVDRGDIDTSREP